MFKNTHILKTLILMISCCVSGTELPSDFNYNIIGDASTGAMEFSVSLP